MIEKQIKQLTHNLEWEEELSEIDNTSLSLQSSDNSSTDGDRKSQTAWESEISDSETKTNRILTMLLSHIDITEAFAASQSMQRYVAQVTYL